MLRLTVLQRCFGNTICRSSFRFFSNNRDNFLPSEPQRDNQNVTPRQRGCSQQDYHDPGCPPSGAQNSFSPYGDTLDNQGGQSSAYPADGQGGMSPSYGQGFQNCRQPPTYPLSNFPPYDGAWGDQGGYSASFPVKGQGAMGPNFAQGYQNYWQSPAGPSFDSQPAQLPSFTAQNVGQQAPVSRGPPQPLSIPPSTVQRPTDAARGQTPHEQPPTQGGSDQKKRDETFASMLRNSKLLQLGNPDGRIVMGEVIRIMGDDLYIDFGCKFPCVCKRPAKDANSFRLGTRVRLELHDLEMSSRFLGSTKDLTILEADATLLGLFETSIYQMTQQPTAYIPSADQRAQMA